MRFRFPLLIQIKLQESPEDMPAGQTPHTVILFAHNDLVDKVQPGDRVNVTGKNVNCINERSLVFFVFVFLTLFSPLAWSCLQESFES